MTLLGQVENAAPSVPGFDCNAIVSPALAQQFYAQGYKFCIRYLSRGPESLGDLSEEEAAAILNAGLALMPVQHGNPAGWLPTEALGQQDGENAAQNALDVGFPEGVTVWSDLEAVSASAVPEDVISYCKAWYKEVRTAGYIPGLYVGAHALLTGEQLYALPFQHYWRSPGAVPDIPHRSYQLFQLFPSVVVNGVQVDLDVTKTDNKGGTAQWLRVSTPG